MAVLEKIRKRTVFLILVIGLALFAFVISGIFSRTKTPDQLVIGEVNGDKISYLEFSSQVENTLRNMGGSIGQAYVVNALWQQTIQSKILDQQFEKLGISVGKDQILSIISKVPQYAQNPQFLDDKGVFSPAKFGQVIAQIKQSNPTVYKQWQQEEKSYFDTAKREIYLSLIRAGLGVTLKDGEDAYHQENDKVTIKYVTLPYSSIPDEQIKISDNEIQDYVKAHKKQYQQKDMRNLQFVLASEVASPEDKKAIEQDLKALNNPRILYNNQTQKSDTLPGFSQVPLKDIAEFVNENSDTPFDSLYVSKDKLPVNFADTLYNLSIGELYGPYQDGNAYKYTRMLSKIPNGEVRASHILIAYQGSLPGNDAITRTKEEAKAKAEGILAQIKAGGDYTALAQANSDDASNAQNGGDLDFFSRGMMVQPFNDYVFHAKVGDIGLVETNFGFHIIKITDLREGVKLATITRNIEPSAATRDAVYTKITEFDAQAIKNPKEFAALAQKAGYDVLPANNLEALAEDIPGLGDDRPLVKWAFEKDTKVGDVRRFDIKDGYIVAQLTKKIEAGLASPSEARAQVAPILIKEKKAKQLIEKMKGSSLEQIAQAAGEANNIQQAEGVSIKNPILPGQGAEESVAGAALVLPLNKVSKPIVGDNGVYVIQVIQKDVAPALPNYSSYMGILRNQKLNRASQDLFSALEQTAEIKDDRAMYY